MLLFNYKLEVFRFVMSIFVNLIPLVLLVIVVIFLQKKTNNFDFIDSSKYPLRSQFVNSGSRFVTIYMPIFILVTIIVFYFSFNLLLPSKKDQVWLNKASDCMYKIEKYSYETMQNGVKVPCSTNEEFAMAYSDILQPKKINSDGTMLVDDDLMLEFSSNGAEYCSAFEENCKVYVHPLNDRLVKKIGESTYKNRFTYIYGSIRRGMIKEIKAGERLQVNYDK